MIFFLGCVADCGLIAVRSSAFLPLRPTERVDNTSFCSRIAVKKIRFKYEAYTKREPHSSRQYEQRMPCNWRSPGLVCRSVERLTKEHVSRVIAKIGKEAKVVVRQADERKKSRVKYASAHDLRRGCALRLINAGVSAETLMVVMRHADFATTQKFYGAMRSAQSAAAEVRQKLSAGDKPPLLGGFVGGT